MGALVVLSISLAVVVVVVGNEPLPSSPFVDFVGKMDYGASGFLRIDNKIIYGTIVVRQHATTSNAKQ